jgi:hypothetical protein
LPAFKAKKVIILMKKIFSFLLALLLVQGVFAQETPKTPKNPIGGRPNIPSDLKFEFGFSSFNNRPEELGINFFPSRTFNVYYQYPVAILGEKSGMTMDIGLGIGTDKFGFKNDQTLFNNVDLGPESSELLDITDVYGDNIRINKNVVSANYFDIPVDFTYHLNKANYSKGFRVSLGAKIGYLYNVHTKISYEDSDGLKRKVKDSQNYGFEKFRYGISLKAGSPGFYVWSYFGLNNVFQSGQGPFGNQASQLSFGLALNVF